MLMALLISVPSLKNPGFWLLISRRFSAGYQGQSPWLDPFSLHPAFREKLGKRVERSDLF
jgi:hypothetical protein